MAERAGRATAGDVREASLVRARKLRSGIVSGQTAAEPSRARRAVEITGAKSTGDVIAAANRLPSQRRRWTGRSSRSPEAGS